MTNLFLGNIKSNHIKTLFYLAFFMTLLMITAFSAAATTNTTNVDDPTGIVTIFCNVIGQITGGIGKVIAILILISMAIGLFIGKISWGLAIAVMVGMGLLFGASGVVGVITGSNQDVCSTLTPAP
jgi:type IV secretion system protein VirB2